MMSELEFVTTENFLGDFQLPCDYGREAGCPRPAEWVLYRKPCCTSAFTPALACDQCKEARLMNRIAVECEGCGHVVMDAASAYSHMERLRK